MAPSPTDSTTGTSIAASLAITLYLIVSNANLSEAFGKIGYLVGYGYGYVFLYLLISISALAYAFREGCRRAWFLLSAVVAGAVMILVYWYSFDPLPEHPVDIYLYGFAAFVALLLVGCCVARVVAPEWLRRMSRVEVSDAE